MRNAPIVAELIVSIAFAALMYCAILGVAL